jgi:gas vesicle protein
MQEQMHDVERVGSPSMGEVSLLTFFALMLGAGIGTLLTLLFAPKEGEALRHDLAKIMDKRLDEAEKQFDDLLNNLQDIMKDLS